MVTSCRASLLHGQLAFGTEKSKETHEDRVGMGTARCFSTKTHCDLSNQFCPNADTRVGLTSCLRIAHKGTSHLVQVYMPVSEVYTVYTLVRI